MSPEGASFIPKSGVRAVQRTRSTRRIYVLAYISYVVFFSTLFAVIGVYIYGATVSRSLSSLQTQLVTERQRFSVTDIDNIQQLSLRLTTAKNLLGESTAPSRLFADIESIVASNIYFSGMSYKQLPNRQFKIELTGRANNFADIIGQRNLLGNSSLLQDATVVDYDYSVGGDNAAAPAAGPATLTFVFSDTRDLSAIAYMAGSEAVSTVTPAASEASSTATVIEGTALPAVDVASSTPASTAATASSSEIVGTTTAPNQSTN